MFNHQSKAPPAIPNVASWTICGAVVCGIVMAAFGLQTEHLDTLAGSVAAIAACYTVFRWVAYKVGYIIGSRAGSAGL